jgi:hypothetical protein
MAGRMAIHCFGHPDEYIGFSPACVRTHVPLAPTTGTQSVYQPLPDSYQSVNATDSAKNRRLSI